MKSKIVFLISLCILLSLLFYVNPVEVNSADGYPVYCIETELDRGGAAGAGFCLVKVSMTTESDWTRFVIKSGETISNARINISEGEGTPDLSVGWEKDTIYIHKEVMDPTKISIECLIALSGLKNVTDIDLEIQRGHLGYTMVRIYNLNGETPLFIREVVHSEIYPPRLNPLGFSMKDEVLIRGGPIYVEARVPKMVWAFYYLSYRSEDWEEPIYADHPYIGNYSSSDPDDLQKHIRLAKAAGIDGFIVYWSGGGAYTEQNLNKILDIAASESFGITINLEILEEGRPRNPAEIEEMLSYFLRRYGDYEAYYRLDDTPVIFVSAAEDHPLEIWKTIFENLRSRGRNAVYIACMLDDSYLEVFEGIYTCDTVGIENLSEVYDRTSNICKTYSLLDDVNETRIWAATVCPGYDERLIPGLDGLFRDRENGGYYQSTFDAAMNSDPDWLLVTSFNEWPGNTHIEPSVKYGFKYTDMTEKFSSSFKGIESRRDNLPPSIEDMTQHPPIDDVTINDNVTISANISDMGTGVIQAKLSWTTNHINWYNTTMNYNPAAKQYEGVIPRQPSGTLVSYKIIAYDYSGNTNASEPISFSRSTVRQVPPPENAAVAMAVGASVTVGFTAFMGLSGYAQSFKRIVSKLPIPDWLKDFLDLYAEKTFEGLTSEEIDAQKGKMITLGSLLSLLVSAIVLLVVFVYVEVNGLPYFLKREYLYAAIPQVLISVVSIFILKQIFSFISARSLSVWSEFKLWLYGLAALLITGIIFKIPFASPGKMEYRGDLNPKRAGLIAISEILCILISSIPFYIFHTVGLTTIGDAGLMMAMMTACYSVFPFKPFEGEAIFRYHKGIWVTTFFPSLSMFICTVFNLLPLFAYLLTGTTATLLFIVLILKLKKQQSHQ